MEDGEGPREKEVTECGEIEPALHDGESAQLDLRTKRVGHSLVLREWGQGRESRAGEELPSDSSESTVQLEAIGGGLMLVAKER